MKVEIYSDVACPWCYVGKKRFEQALAAYAGRDQVQVVMRPFQLDGTLSGDPERAVPAAEHYARKFGPQFKQMEARLAEVARRDGIDYRAEAIRVTNTFDAHRLLWLAEHEGGPALQARVAEALFKGYFTDGRVVSDREALVVIATEAGLDEARVRSFLDSDEGASEVRQQIEGAHRVGVTAVPTFVFEDQWAVSGAQEVATFVQVLETVAQNVKAEAEHGASCHDGACEI
jgi:predicted DsbA family dithiol-disulfide isomerase